MSRMRETAQQEAGTQLPQQDMGVKSKSKSAKKDKARNPGHK